MQHDDCSSLGNKGIAAVEGCRRREVTSAAAGKTYLYVTTIRRSDTSYTMRITLQLQRSDTFAHTFRIPLSSPDFKT